MAHIWPLTTSCHPDPVLLETMIIFVGHVGSVQALLLEMSKEKLPSFLIVLNLIPYLVQSREHASTSLVGQAQFETLIDAFAGMILNLHTNFLSEFPIYKYQFDWLFGNLHFCIIFLHLHCIIHPSTLGPVLWQWLGQSLILWWGAMYLYHWGIS